MKKPPSLTFTAKCLSLTFALAVSHLSYADLSDLEGEFTSQLEEYSAASVQGTYAVLQEHGCTDEQRGATQACDEATFRTWSTVRELVHTANDLTGAGPTLYSLGLDLEGLGFAMRWTAGEEFSTQGDMSTNFLRGQMTGLASRMTALRGGTGSIAMGATNQNNLIALGHEGPLGGGAGSDLNAQWSRWGFFLNADYTSGDRTATEREDAFDFDGTAINTGVDYRFSLNWVGGVMLGHQSETVEFDPNQSIVEGTVDMTGLSLQPYMLYSGERLFFSAAVGFQSMDFDTERTISYPSLNPQIESTDTVAISGTSASSYTFSSTLGYSFFQHSAFGMEPFVALNYRNVSVDGYSETDIENEGHAFIVAEQSFGSTESTLGLKFNYLLTPNYGVFIPYVDIEYRTQHDTAPRQINAQYVDVADIVAGESATVFSLPTDELDSNYMTFTVGMSAVLRGSSQKNADGAASGGLQAFIQYREFINLEYYNQSQISGGLRYEF